MSDPIRKPDEFPSRSESILSDTIGLEGYSIETPPRSRIEKLLIELKEIIDQGGGSSTAYATSLEITMDEYFVMSATLKNKDGDTLGQVQTVDLPLESVVVNGSYDSINKNVVLTLENGNTVSFSVADLVSGLQTEITSNNKLDADLVDDTNSTHKFTTASDISKLAGIEEHANKTVVDSSITDGGTNPVTGGSIYTALARKLETDTHYAGSSTTGGSATSAAKLDNSKDAGSATQPVYFSSGVPTATTYSLAKSVPADAVFTDTTYESKAAASGGTDVSLVTTGDKYIWNNKQNTIDANNKLSADLVDDANTAHKFATAEQFSQITINENNISLLETMNGSKNKFNISAWSTCAVTRGTKSISGTDITISSTGYNCYTAFANPDYPIAANIPVSEGEQIVITWRYSTSDSATGQVHVFPNGSAEGAIYRDAHTYDNLPYTIPSGCTYITIRFGVLEDGKSATYSNVQVMSKTAYDAGFTDYQPYAMSNAELTVKEQTNENNILYNTNNGVKNTFDFANAPQEANIYTTVSKTATSLTVTANNPNAGSSSVVYSGKDYPAGDYIFSCKITDYSCTTETARIYIATSTAASTSVANKTITGNGTIQIPFHWNGGKVYVKYFPHESNTINQSNTFTASENMIMIASISDNTYQPYAMSNAELTAAIQALQAQLANQ